MPHGNDGVQVVAHSLGVGGEEVGFGSLDAPSEQDGFHGGVDLLQVVKHIDVGHVASVQNVVDVLQERLALDLES